MWASALWFYLMDHQMCFNGVLLPGKIRCIIFVLNDRWSVWEYTRLIVEENSHQLSFCNSRYSGCFVWGQSLQSSGYDPPPLIHYEQQDPCVCTTKEKIDKLDKLETYNDGLSQDCGNSSVLAMELPQSCIKPSISSKSGNILWMLTRL